MIPTLEAEIRSDVIITMKLRDNPEAKVKLGVLRLILAAIKQIQIDNKHKTFDNAAILIVLDKMVKQRNESIRQYKLAKRTDLVQQELFENSLINKYRPKPLSDLEINCLITTAFEYTHANSIRDMGKVMAYLKPKIQSRADMSVVSMKVKHKLTNIL